MKENYIPSLNSSEKLIIKYKKKKYKTPKCLNVLLILLFILSILSIYALLKVIQSQKNEKKFYLNEYNKLKNLIEKEDNEIKLSKENISEMTNELLNLSAKYFNIEIKLSRMSKEQEQIEKELYNLKIDLSYKHIISFSAIISNINQIKKIISYIISNVNLDKLYHPKIRQIYKSSYDEKQGKAFIEQLIGNSFIIILVKISQETIFGGFFYKNITTNSNIYDENAFLFSLNHDEYYKINKGKRPYWINKEIFFSFGDNDIYLPNDCFYTNSAFSNFPNSYGNNSCISHILTNGNKYFIVQDIEAYQFYE
jgi:hypothetical protein